MIAVAVIFSYDKSMVCLSMVHCENRYNIPLMIVPEHQDPMVTICEITENIFGEDNVGPKWFVKKEEVECNTLLNINGSKYIAACIAHDGARPAPGFGWIDVSTFHEILTGLDNASDYSYVMDALTLFNKAEDIGGYCIR